jgi:UDP-N-acetylmuramate-alanine ligase
MGCFAGKKFHFIGIGGIGTSGLAKLLMKHGALISGSDTADGAVLQELIGRGAAIHIGHRAENPPNWMPTARNRIRYPAGFRGNSVKRMPRKNWSMQGNCWTL